MAAAISTLTAETSLIAIVVRSRIAVTETLRGTATGIEIYGKTGRYNKTVVRLVKRLAVRRERSVWSATFHGQGLGSQHGRTSLPVGSALTAHLALAGRPLRRHDS